MTTTKAPPKKKADPLLQLAELESAWTAAEDRHQVLSRELVAKRQVLDGPTANDPGLLDELRSLRQRDPVQFKSDGTPTGPDAKTLKAKIDEVGDLDQLAAEVEHAGLLAAKARGELDGFVAAHALSILAAKRPQFEGQQAAVAAALDRLRQALADYDSGARNVSGLLGAAGLPTRVPGEEQAEGLRRSLKHVTPPPVAIPDDLGVE